MTNHREMALPLCKELLAEIGRGRIDKSRLTANFRWKSNGGNDFTAAQVNERLPVLLSSTEDGFRVEPLAAIVEGQRVAIEAVSHAKLRTEASRVFRRLLSVRRSYDDDKEQVFA